MTTPQMSIVIGSDHAAFKLKEIIKLELEKQGIAVTDAGPFNEESVDYPDYALKVARKVAAKEFDRGILMCGTGLGMSLAANRVPKVRATLCNDLFSAIMGRRHNDSNILVMGGRVVGDVLAIEILKAWLNTPFEGGRHQNRLDKFDSVTG